MRERRFDRIPFSEGPARCLGQDFNLLEIFQVVDRLLRRYRRELVDPSFELPESRAAISGPAEGSLRVRIARRVP